jgi:signal transduction histidine kinase
MADPETRELARIRDLLKAHPKGMTIEEIARQLPLNRTSTAKYLNTLLISGQAEMRTFGRAKVFSLTQRVPVAHLISLSSEMILILNRELEITNANDRLLQVFGLQSGDLVSHPIGSTPLAGLFGPDLLGNLKVAAEGEEMVSEQSIRTGGHDLTFITKLIPVVFDEGGQGLAVILEDITELKNYQRHLEQLVADRTAEIVNANQELEREIREHQAARGALAIANRKLNLLASMIRHDILNHITAISGYIQILGDSLSGDPEKKRYISNIQQAITTIQDEITFTRDYKDLGVNLPQWQQIGNVITAISPVGKYHGITVSSTLGNLEVYADPFLGKVFSSIFDYLIRNGNAGSGIRFSCRVKKDRCLILIESSGKGIPQALKARLFDADVGKQIGFQLVLAKEILSITEITISETGLPDESPRFEISIPPGRWRA